MKIDLKTNSKTEKKSVLIVGAMEDEIQGLIEKEGYSVVYTGIGKINAAHHLTKALIERRARGETVELVLNFGTAGSSVFPRHSLVECTTFVQRDMDVSAIGFALGETPLDPLPRELKVPRRFSELAEGVCGTGDSFETGKPKVACTVVDMEGYALAKVCALEKTHFASIKYISDGSDETAAGDWAESLPKAASKFVELLAKLNAAP
ncbi:MAG: 5'-nucleosidase [Proteobacteria bacterium]|nr:MAG: 5'-nucleosidase [Pseudomonadota bacterium]